MIHTDERFDIRFLDASRISRFSRCEAKCMFECFMGLKPQDASNICLDYGTTMHVVLPEMFSGNPKEAFRVFDKTWAKFPHGEEDPKRNTARSRLNIDNFVRSHAPSSCSYKILEFPFASPTDLISRNEIPFLVDVGLKYPLTGRIDMPIRWNATGSLWVYDFKMQPLDAVILTPEGPVIMDDIEVGDYVIGSNGKGIRVTGVYPHGMKKIYKIHTRDGAVVEAGAEHLWSIRYKSTGEKERSAVVTTLELIERLKKKRKPYFPLIEPVEFCFRSISIDPYTLGALLGDGCMKGTPRITGIDNEIFEQIRKEYPTTECNSHDHCPSLSVKGIKILIKELGLSECMSHDKFIPEDYIYNIKHVRQRMLQGLMDTDGTVNPSGTPVFCTTSARLAAGVKLIVESLGGVCSITFYMSKIGDVEYGIAFQCVFRLLDNADAFSLSRKKNKIRNDYEQSFMRKIVSVEEAGMKRCQCIKVDAKDGIYLTEDFIPTHNTSSELSDRYFNGFWMSPQACIYTIALNQITQEKVEGLVIEGMRVSKCNVETQIGFTWVHDYHAKKFLAELRYTIDMIDDANRTGNWRQNFALCSSYAGFGFPCRACEYKMICDLPEWQDGARFYKREKPFDPLETKEELKKI